MSKIARRLGRYMQIQASLMKRCRNITNGDVILFHRRKNNITPMVP